MHHAILNALLQEKIAGLLVCSYSVKVRQPHNQIPYAMEEKLLVYLCVSRVMRYTTT